MYEVTIRKSGSVDDRGYKNWETVFEQKVDSMDVWDVIQAVNRYQQRGYLPTPETPTLEL